MEVMKLFISFLMVTIPNPCSSYKFLFYSYCQLPSHKISMLPLAKALQEKGHEVVLYQLSAQPNPINGGVPEKFGLVKHAAQDGWDSLVHKNTSALGDFVWKSYIDAFSTQLWWHVLPKWFCAPFLANQREEFLELANQNWDLIFVDSLFTACGYATVAVARKPYVIMHTGALEHTTPEQRGLPTLTHTYPNLFGQDSWTINSFWFRLDGFFDYWRYKILDRDIEAAVYSVLSPFLPEFSVAEWLQSADAAFVDYPQNFDWPRPLGGDLISTSGLCATDRKKIPTEILSFIGDSSSKGTILVSFGSVVSWKTAPKDVFDSFLTMFHNLSEYRFLFAYQGTYKKFPANVLAKQWLSPQSDILKHEKVKLFISHGGLKSFKETICAEKPAVYVPMFADQHRNSLAAKTWGFGEILKKTNVKPDLLMETVKRVAEGASYHAAVKRAKALWLDQVQPPVAIGTFWSEFIVRHNGMPEIFRRKGAELPWYKYWSVDIAIYVTFIGVILMICLRSTVLLLIYAAKK